MGDLNGRGVTALRRLVGGPGFAPDWLHEPPDWMLDALCAQTDPDAFHVEKGGSTITAKQICSMCTVRAECLAFAMGAELTEYTRYGVYAGLSPKERRRLGEAGWQPGDEVPPIVMPRRGPDVEDGAA